jgi:hypothetical protein
VQNTAHAEEVRKNKGKYIPIPNWPPSSKFPEMVSEYTIRKMAKEAYVEMWYYTNSCIEEAKQNTGTVDDEALVLSQNPDGSSSLVPAGATKQARAVIDDKHLKWEDFCQAVPRMIQAMETTDWQPEQVTTPAQLWGNPMVHRLQLTTDLIDQEALLVYQAQQCQSWHHAITSPEGAWNIGIICEQSLQQNCDKVYQDLIERQIESEMPRYMLDYV